jgi:anti-sigma factor RsiW
MMDPGTALKLQALLDGELSAHEATAWRRRLDEDPEARRLYDELQLTRAVLRQCEPEHSVPETREFYWSRIRQALERGGSPARSPGDEWWNRWLRWVVPAGATALLGLFLLQRGLLEPDREPVLLATDHEVETMLADTTSISFRSESAGMTVVWVQSGRQNHFGSGN